MANAVSSLRISTLPENYRELEYIQAVAGNKINTGIIPTNHYVDIKFDFEEYLRDEHLFGTSGLSDESQIAGFVYHFTTYDSSNVPAKYFYGTGGTENKIEKSFGSWTTGPHTLIYNKGSNFEIIFDGELVGSETKCYSDTELMLFTRDTSANFSGKMYYMKIGNNNTGLIERNFIPCINPSGEIGLYDTITKTFFGNNGTGYISAGPFKEVEYKRTPDDEELIRSFISLIDSSRGANFIKFPDGFTEIGYDAFYGKSGLKLEKLPDSITKIGMSAFNMCTNLALTELPEGLTTIENNAFSGCSKLALTKLPSKITRINDYAFSSCRMLTLTELPDSLNYIGNGAFQTCDNIMITEIPEGVIKINNNTFSNCKKIESLICKGEITNIVYGAFSGCLSLTKLIFSNITEVPTLDNVGAFNRTPIEKYNNTVGYIYVPDNLVEDFKVATNWSTYADQIKPISELEV